MDETRIGDYTLRRRLGSGGQGTVYLATDPQGDEVAVKVWEHVSADPAERRRMVKEVAAARQVSSFCTARVLDADVEGERPYVVSEYVPGPSLREAVARRGPLAGDELYRLAVGMATALAARPSERRPSARRCTAS